MIEGIAIGTSLRRSWVFSGDGDSSALAVAWKSSDVRGGNDDDGALASYIDGSSCQLPASDGWRVREFAAAGRPGRRGVSDAVDPFVASLAASEQPRRHDFVNDPTGHLARCSSGTHGVACDSRSAGYADAAKRAACRRGPGLPDAACCGCADSRFCANAHAAGAVDERRRACADARAATHRFEHASRRRRQVAAGRFWEHERFEVG